MRRRAARSAARRVARFPLLKSDPEFSIDAPVMFQLLWHS